MSEPIARSIEPVEARTGTSSGAFGKALVLGIDAGGTMTDTFIVDEDGSFVVGKAATTPWNESEGFLESVDDALRYTNLADSGELFGNLQVTLYSGTAMLNALLSRSGQQVGVLITKGMEDSIRQGRGAQSWAEYSYADRLHAVTHVHPPALVQQSRIKGITERIDVKGEVAIPLYEHEVAPAVEALLDDGVEAICVCFLASYLNDAHELRAAELAEEVVRARGSEIPVFRSSRVRPVMREVSRFNSTVIEAYAAAPARKHLIAIEEAIQSRGFEPPLQTMLSYGGLANVHYPRLHETMISGPVGGILGAQYVGKMMGVDNLVVSDLGGTSFDIGSVTAGHIPINSESSLARFTLNLPTIALESIGAGTGTIIKVDPITKHIELGPESVGSSPGPVCFGQGGTRASITDCDLLLGYLNPDNFLGGRVKLDTELAERAIREQVTDPIGIDLYEGAEGIVRLLETQAREALRRTVSARGFDPPEYCLLGYGGAGPLHLAGYSSGLGFKDVLTFPYAAAFSAFGCTTADYLHRYTRSVFITIPPFAGEQEKAQIAEEFNRMWAEIADEARTDMEAEGRDMSALTLTPLAMLRYTGQLDDVEIPTPRYPLNGAADLDELIARWEDEYERINRRVSRYPEAGYTVFELGMLASTPKAKPKIAKSSLGDTNPSRDAELPSRKIFWGGEWVEARIWDMERLVRGNKVVGPAIIEHPATTYVIPPGSETFLDEWNVFHLRDEGAGK